MSFDFDVGNGNLILTPQGFGSQRSAAIKQKSNFTLS